jgi:hypothetical protein
MMKYGRCGRGFSLCVFVCIYIYIYIYIYIHIYMNIYYHCEWSESHSVCRVYPVAIVSTEAVTIWFVWYELRLKKQLSMGH